MIVFSIILATDLNGEHMDLPTAPLPSLHGLRNADITVTLD